MREDLGNGEQQSPNQDELDPRTEWDQFAVYYKTIPGLLIANLLVSVATAILFTGFPPAWWTYHWIGAHCIVIGIRAWAARGFNPELPDYERRGWWKLQAILGSGATGLLWGIGALIFFEPRSLANNAILIVLLGTINSVGALSLSQVKKAFLALLFASMPLLVIRLVLVSDLVSIVIACTTVFYSFLLYWTGHVAHRTYREIYKQRTYHLNALEAVSASESRLRSILDAMPVPLVIAGLENPMISYANAAAYEEFGYSEEDPVVGSSVHEYWAHPDDREIVERQLIEQHFAKDVEAEFRRKNGKTFWGIISSSLMEYEGKPSVLSAISDITERKNIEKEVIRLLRFQESVIESANDSFVVFDSNFKIIIWNHAAEEMSGYTRQEMTDGNHSFLDLIIEDDVREDFKSGGEAIVAGTLDAHVEEASIRRKDGSTRVIAWRARAMKDEEGRIMGLIALGRDVTERITRERELRESHRKLEERTLELEELNRELDAFAHSVSHDLRTPIGHISGFSQMLIDQLEDGAEEDAKKAANRIIAVSKRMEELISDLMLLSRAGKMELRVDSVELSMIVRECITFWHEREPEREMDIDIAPDVSADADPSLIKVAIENLINNAWKYTAKKERTEIRFGVERIDGENIYHIKDNGVGFDPDRRDELFQTFSRLHTDDEFRGTGLGLATVERIIRRHGGRIWAEGDPGKGATFYFTLHV